MEILEKLEILSDAAKYDVSCSSSGSSRTNTGGLGNAAVSGVCHSWSEDGRCISLLKILFTNRCIYNCIYCRNRSSNDIPRAAFTVDEVVDLTINLYRRNYIEGLFLSSGIVGSPEKTMDLLYKIAKKLREEHNFYGYIHLKGIPGASMETIRKAGLYADRMSVNIELPSSGSLKLLAPQKSRNDIIQPMLKIGNEYSALLEDRKKYKSTPMFLPAGHTTQMIIGASPESDYQIINLMENLYNKFHLKRVYYSAYIPVNNDNLLPAVTDPPLNREHRLYQADWLLRFYKFKAHEILDEEQPYLDEKIDPKAGWAIRHMEFFPVEINTAEYEVLLRVPGIGVKSARRIITARRHNSVDFDNLRKMGIVLKRAKYFITCRGRVFEKFKTNPEVLRQRLLPETKSQSLQLLLF